jgi:hypothetical protein
LGDIKYENGNIFSPVIVLADDPTNEDNVLVSRLNTAVSIPKNTISSSEGTPSEEATETADEEAAEDVEES